MYVYIHVCVHANVYMRIAYMCLRGHVHSRFCVYAYVCMCVANLASTGVGQLHHEAREVLANTGIALRSSGTVASEVARRARMVLEVRCTVRNRCHDQL